MKKKISLSLVIIFLMQLNIFSSEKIVMAIGDWEPFTSSRDKNAKIAEKVVTEAFKIVGIDIEYEYFPWKRCHLITKKGKIVGTFPWIKTDERVKDFYVSEDYIIKDRTVFFHLRENNFRWDSFKDLEKYKVGATDGYSVTKTLEDNSVLLDIAPKEDLNYKKLLTKRIDIYPTAFYVGYYQLNMLYEPSKAKLFTNHPKSIGEDTYHMLISKKFPNGKELMDKFEKGLKELKESGKYEKIIEVIMKNNGSK